jgi:predicted metal-binding protein
MGKAKAGGTGAFTVPIQKLVDKALALGALDAKVIPAPSVETGHWVRWKCRYGCGGYGRSLVCPPNTPTPAETRQMLDQYKAAILFESPHGEAKRIAVELEREVFLAGYYRAFGLGAGPCHKCRACALGKGCRHPSEARPAMEAVGIDVYATVRKHGFTINVVRTHDDPQHYFGLVLVE